MAAVLNLQLRLTGTFLGNVRVTRRHGSSARACTVKGMILIENERETECTGWRSPILVLVGSTREPLTTKTRTEGRRAYLS